MPRTILIGGDGFIGRHLAFGLRDLGHTIICVARDTSALASMGFETISADLCDPEVQSKSFWQEHLEHADHVVNCAGLLNGSNADFTAVHVTTPQFIYEALPRKASAVLISAVGIDADTAFSRFRRQGEAIAREHNVSILRCGLVLADTSYGGSSLIRAISAFPIATPLPSGADPQFNPIHATDLAAVVDSALRNPPKTNPIDIGGPETLSLAQLISHYRSWLGLRKAPILRLPSGVMNIAGFVGDMCKMGPISRTSLRQINAGVVADTTQMTLEIAARPRSFSQFANARPAGTADLWHARLYLMKPAVRLALALLWLLSGLIGVFLPTDQFLPLLNTTLPDAALVVLARAGGIIDLQIALALIRDWHPKRVTQIQFAMILGYTAVFTVLNPALWLLPLGGLLKNIPILVLLLVHTILQKER